MVILRNAGGHCRRVGRELPPSSVTGGEKSTAWFRITATCNNLHLFFSVPGQLRFVKSGSRVAIDPTLRQRVETGPVVIVCENADVPACRAADLIVQSAREAIAERQRFSLVLSGGSRRPRIRRHGWRSVARATANEWCESGVFLATCVVPAALTTVLDVGDAGPRGARREPCLRPGGLHHADFPERGAARCLPGRGRQQSGCIARDPRRAGRPGCWQDPDSCFPYHQGSTRCKS